MKLGLALTFYAKYPREIDRLYGEDQGVYKILMPWLSNKMERNEIANLIKQVSNQADKEVKTFLLKVKDKVEVHLAQSCNFTSIKVRSPWKLSWWIWPKGYSKKLNVQVGVFIDTKDKNLVAFPWVWVKGGRRQELELIKIFNNEVKSAKELGWCNSSAGSVGFPCILFEVKISETNVNAEELFENIIFPFRSITNEQIKAIYKLK